MEGMMKEIEGVKKDMERLRKEKEEQSKWYIRIDVQQLNW